MKFNFLFKSFLTALLITISTSCDKDYNDIGTSIIDNGNYTSTVDSTSVSIKA